MCPFQYIMGPCFFLLIDVGKILCLAYIFIIVSFDKQKFLILIKYVLFIFSYTIMPFVFYLEIISFNTSRILRYYLQKLLSLLLHLKPQFIRNWYLCICKAGVNNCFNIILVICPNIIHRKHVLLIDYFAGSLFSFFFLFLLLSHCFLNQEISYDNSVSYYLFHFACLSL
jgi:hypothetical protein